VHAGIRERDADRFEGVSLSAKLHDLGAEIPRLARSSARSLGRDKPHHQRLCLVGVRQVANLCSLLVRKPSVPVRIRRSFSLDVRLRRTRISPVAANFSVLFLLVNRRR